MCLAIPVCSKKFRAVPGAGSLGPCTGPGTTEDPMPASSGLGSPSRNSTKHCPSTGASKGTFHGPPQGKQGMWRLPLTAQPGHWAQTRCSTTSTSTLAARGRAHQCPSWQWGWGAAAEVAHSYMPKEHQCYPKCCQPVVEVDKGPGRCSRGWFWCCPEPLPLHVTTTSLRGWLMSPPAPHCWVLLKQCTCVLQNKASVYFEILNMKKFDYIRSPLSPTLEMSTFVNESKERAIRIFNYNFNYYTLLNSCKKRY